MNYDLAEEELELYAMVKDFADTVVAPRSYEADTKHELPMDIVAQMGELGLFGLPFPEEYGGQGGNYFALCLAIEALARQLRPVERLQLAFHRPRRRVDQSRLPGDEHGGAGRVLRLRDQVGGRGPRRA